jgi:transcriptional regulator with GAF, ATPase, and Fis domain
MASTSALVATPRFSLVTIEGPAPRVSFEIDAGLPGPTLVGQSAACAIRVSDRQVSRRHAALDIADQHLRITDLDSLNGTHVNGVRIREAFLSGGEVVRIGQTSLRVELLNPAVPVEISPTASFGRVVGASLEMRRLHPLFEALARSDVPVVIEGETGTGKELLAESLHELGPRAAGPFVVFDCTAIAPTLVESELFGHERGAFTGAVSPRRGTFEQAHGGTLLIDEIGDMPLPLQPKLLRVIERGEVKRVGSERSIKVDVRILAATRRDLDREIVAGRFRDDLFHRLAVARVELPPLRRRIGDVAVLAQIFCAQMGRAEAAIPESLLRAWTDHGWPGNVRELRNAVARQLALGALAPLERSFRTAASSPPDSAAGAGILEHIVASGLPFVEARRRVIEELEQRYIERVLAEHGGNVTRAAKASGIARRQLQRVKARIGK